MTNLGYAYENGLGVTQTEAEARNGTKRPPITGTAGAVEALESLDIKDRRYDEALRLARLKRPRRKSLRQSGTASQTAKQRRRSTKSAWCALFAREFDTALSALERAHALLPADLMIETNRAHALMFLGREEEARVLESCPQGDDASPRKISRSWERATADDFAEFRKAGLAHPMMGEIEKQLGVAR